MNLNTITWIYKEPNYKLRTCCPYLLHVWLRYYVNLLDVCMYVRGLMYFFFSFYKWNTMIIVSEHFRSDMHMENKNF